MLSGWFIFYNVDVLGECPEVVTHVPWSDAGGASVEVLLADGTYGSIQLPDGNYPMKRLEKGTPCPDMTVGVRTESKKWETTCHQLI